MHYIRSTARAGAALATAVALALPAQAGAQLQLGGSLDQQGGGLGNQVTVLTLQSPGNTSNESGCSLTLSCPFTAVGVLGAQTGPALLSDAALTGLTGENVRVVANFSEPQTAQSNVTLNDLRLFLFSGSGNNATLLFQSMALQPANQNLVGLAGVGNFGFVFSLTGMDVTTFNTALAGRSPSTVSIGVGASVSNAEGGLDTFSIARGTTTGAVIPEPSTYVLMGTGLLGLAGLARRRNRKA